MYGVIRQGSDSGHPGGRESYVSDMLVLQARKEQDPDELYFETHLVPQAWRVAAQAAIQARSEQSMVWR